ncbi:MAG: hypothetical protein HQK89_07585 [Nitrospirae bacterium]|nr:hypothetical protein [Nitrospirota bacterium]
MAASMGLNTYSLYAKIYGSQQYDLLNRSGSNGKGTGQNSKNSNASKPDVYVNLSSTAKFSYRNAIEFPAVLDEGTATSEATTPAPTTPVTSTPASATLAGNTSATATPTTATLATAAPYDANAGSNPEGSTFAAAYAATSGSSSASTSGSSSAASPGTTADGAASGNGATTNATGNAANNGANNAGRSSGNGNGNAASYSGWNASSPFNALYDGLSKSFSIPQNKVYKAYGAFSFGSALNTVDILA